MSTKFNALDDAFDQALHEDKKRRKKDKHREAAPAEPSAEMDSIWATVAALQDEPAAPPASDVPIIPEDKTIDMMIAHPPCEHKHMPTMRTERPEPIRPAGMAAGMLMYDYGRRVALAGQVLPFCNINEQKWNNSMSHVLITGLSPGVTDAALDRTTTVNWADGMFGFSGRVMSTSRGLDLSMDVLLPNEATHPPEALFPTFYLSAEDEVNGAAPLTMINPMTGQEGKYVPLSLERYIQPYCAATQGAFTEATAEVLTRGILSQFGLCTIYIGMEVGPRPGSVQYSMCENYLEFIKCPRTLSEVLAAKAELGLAMPTCDVDQIGLGRVVGLRDWHHTVRKQLNANATGMRERLLNMGF